MFQNHSFCWILLHQGIFVRLLCSAAFLGVSTGAVSPPVALEMGVGLLCQLFQMWGQVAAGMVNLIQWLLGDEQSDTRCEESLDLVRSTLAFFLCNFFFFNASLILLMFGSFLNFGTKFVPRLFYSHKWHQNYDTKIWQLIVERGAITFQNCEMFRFHIAGDEIVWKTLKTYIDGPIFFSSLDSGNIFPIYFYWSLCWRVVSYDTMTQAQMFCELLAAVHWLVEIFLQNHG